MKAIIIIAMVSAVAGHCHAQGVKVSTSPGTPDPSAIFEAASTTQGLLPPRMTEEERDAIISPALGLMIFNTSTNCTNVFIGTNWQELCGTCTPQVDAPAAGIQVPSETQIEWHWNAVAGAQGYKWSAVNNYATANDLGNATSYLQSGLPASTPHVLYVWSYNMCGGSLSPVELNATTTDPPCVIGSVGPGGGRVFYCGSAYPGYIGLEAAPSDQSAAAAWGCGGTNLPGAASSALGSGEQNTVDITTSCGTSGIAARLCSDLTLGGFSDWFLPSRDELTLMYSNLHLSGLGSFSSSIYWTSTEDDETWSYYKDFTSGANSQSHKTGSYRVRAIRKF